MIFFEATQKRLCVSADTSRSSAGTRNISQLNHRYSLAGATLLGVMCTMRDFSIANNEEISQVLQLAGR